MRIATLIIIFDRWFWPKTPNKSDLWVVLNVVWHLNEAPCIQDKMTHLKNISIGDMQWQNNVMLLHFYLLNAGVSHHKHINTSINTRTFYDCTWLLFQLVACVSVCLCVCLLGCTTPRWKLSKLLVQSAESF